MSLRCPECGNRLGRWQVLRFVRLVTIYCPECNSPLSLDKPGRAAVWMPVIVSFLLIVAFSRERGIGYIAPILIIIGFIAGAQFGNRLGKVDITDREEFRS